MNKPARPLAIAAAIAIVSIGVFAAPTAASAHWSCGRSAPPDVDTSGNHITRYTSAVARVGSSERCAIASNYIFQSYQLDYHCYAIDIDRIHTWTYVVQIGGDNLRGWINDGELSDTGSTKRCPGDTN